MDYTDSILPLKRCKLCYARLADDDFYCIDCGYPLKGTTEQQAAFMAEHHDHNQLKLNTMYKNAANNLYYLATAFVFGGLVTLSMKKTDPNVLTLAIPMLILAVSFLILGALTRFKPLLCALAGCFLFFAVQAYNFFANPAALAYGVTIKIIVTAFLIKSVVYAAKLRKMRNQIT